MLSKGPLHTECWHSAPRYNSAHAQHQAPRCKAITTAPSAMVVCVPPLCRATNVGALESVTIGHNNRGLGPAWHLDRVEVHHTGTGQKKVFVHNGWLPTELDKRQFVTLSGSSDAPDLATCALISPYVYAINLVTCTEEPGILTIAAAAKGLEGLPTQGKDLLCSALGLGRSGCTCPGLVAIFVHFCSSKLSIAYHPSLWCSSNCCSAANTMTAMQVYHCCLHHRLQVCWH